MPAHRDNCASCGAKVVLVRREMPLTRPPGSKPKTAIRFIAVHFSELTPGEQPLQPVGANASRFQKNRLLLEGRCEAARLQV